MSKKTNYDLTEGGILNRLLLVALPIMGTQLMQMTFNLVDMFWLGRLSSEAVAASGTGGMFLWLSVALMVLGSMGASIGVAQNLGRRDVEAARRFSETALSIAAILGTLYGALLFFGSDFLIGFFNLDPSVAQSGSAYLAIAGIGIPFSYITAVISATFSAAGNSRLALYVNTVGLFTNLILDPLLIFGLKLGVVGSAVATIFSQIMVCLLLMRGIQGYRDRPFPTYSFFTRPDGEKARQIVTWSLPVVLENALFTSLAMLTTRLIATFGTDAIAVGRIGSQIESLTWLIAGGFGSALTAFVGQNFGAGKFSRIRKGFRISAQAMSVWGILVTVVLYFFGRELFTVFIPDDLGIIDLGKVYLSILAIAQIPGCLEAVAAGSFRGTGRTLPPSLISIISNVLRVVMAYAVAALGFGLLGIWRSIAIAGVLRGLAMMLWYIITDRNLPQEDEIRQEALGTS